MRRLCCNDLAARPQRDAVVDMRQVLKRVWFYRYIYLLMLPGLLYFLVFEYVPMWGIIIAFQDFQFWKGPFNSPWVGFENFRRFFESIYFVRLMRNTLTISLLSLLFAFPAPILLALMLERGATRLLPAIHPDCQLPPSLHLLGRRRWAADLHVLRQCGLCHQCACPI